jgi:hypothetical protein
MFASYWASDGLKLAIFPGRNTMGGLQKDQMWMAAGLAALNGERQAE